MDVELHLLILIQSMLTFSAVCWTALRLRTRGVTTFGAGATTSSGVLTEPHVHEFSERNPTKYGDDKRHCIAPGCGEPKPD